MPASLHSTNVALGRRDLAAFSRGLGALYSEGSTSSLPSRILSCLRNTFDCDFASFSLVDRRRGRLHTSALDPEVSDWPGLEAHQRHMRYDPAAAHIFRTGDQRALKMSDFVSLRQYRDLSVYTEVFGRVGCNRRLGFAIQNQPPVSLVATLNRSGRDFSEQDRTLLNALRAHLLQANERELTQQRLRAQLERERENLGSIFSVGLGEIDPAGRVVWLTSRAQGMLHDFFPLKGHVQAPETLPGEILDRALPALQQSPSAETRWLWHFPGPLGRTLKVRLVPIVGSRTLQLLLEEATAPLSAQALAPALHLTPREGEVLYWLMQGKTNWELGAILGITEKTAGRHLEHIFTKLKVENRTAAVRVGFEASAAL